MEEKFKLFLIVRAYCRDRYSSGTKAAITRKLRGGGLAPPHLRPWFWENFGPQKLILKFVRFCFAKHALAGTRFSVNFFSKNAIFLLYNISKLCIPLAKFSRVMTEK